MLSDTDRKPRVALMGEFSAGKSTLTNLLLGTAPLPVRITATRLPPVLISQGPDGGQREDHAGRLHPLPPDGLEGVRLDDTKLVRLTMSADILDLCDLVDMPGISDPNMGADVWRDVLDEADHLVWCTHATQAWRQSEAAAWDSLPDRLRRNALLLVTRWDKLQSDRDRARVLARLQAETRGAFRGIYPVSLWDAVNAGDDDARWAKSGAEPFVRALVDLVLNRVPLPDMADAPEAPQDADSARVTPHRVRPSQDAPRTARPGAAHV